MAFHPIVGYSVTGCLIDGESGDVLDAGVMFVDTKHEEITVTHGYFEDGTRKPWCIYQHDHYPVLRLLAIPAIGIN